jgi:hypothetical protein
MGRWRMNSLRREAPAPRSIRPHANHDKFGFEDLFGSRNLQSLHAISGYSRRAT